MTETRQKRDRDIALVFAISLLVVMLWEFALLIAPDGGSRCDFQGFGCEADIRFALLATGYVIGPPLVGGSVVVSVIVILVAHHFGLHYRLGLFVAHAFLWSLIAQLFTAAVIIPGLLAAR